jgi:hypothetical protein
MIMKKLGVLLCVTLLVLFGAKLWWENGMRPVNASDTSQKMFLIRKGAGMREIANDLDRTRLDSRFCRILSACQTE